MGQVDPLYSLLATPLLRSVWSRHGGQMTTVIRNLLARKQKLIEQLDSTIDVKQREKIEHQLEQVNTALDFLDRPQQPSD